MTKDPPKPTPLLIRPARSRLDPIMVTYETPVKTWVLMHDASIKLIDLAGNNHGRIQIAQGFGFDLASIPFFFRWLIERHDLSLVAPLVHDYLYTHNGYGSFAVTDRFGITRKIQKKYSRKQCDDFFLELMEAEGVPKWRRKTAYRAVRLFGGLFWNNPVK